MPRNATVYTRCGAGEAVVAGTVNCEGRLEVRAERSGASSALAAVLAGVEAAQARRPQAQHVADLVAGRFAGGVLAAAAATFVFWAAAGNRASSLRCVCLRRLLMAHGACS